MREWQDCNWQKSTSHSLFVTQTKLLAGFNGNSYFINMHFTVKVWPWNAAKIEKWRFKRVRNIIKSPTDIIAYLMQSQFPIKFCLFNMETRIAF